LFLYVDPLHLHLHLHIIGGEMTVQGSGLAQVWATGLVPPEFPVLHLVTLKVEGDIQAFHMLKLDGDNY
jgi:hypothetical protein